MYLIDTDIIIWVLRGQEKYRKLLKKLSLEAPLYISTMTIAEVYKNIFPSETMKTERLLNDLESWDITPPIAVQGGYYWQEYSKRLQNLSIIDCLIAATAKV